MHKPSQNPVKKSLGAPFSKGARTPKALNFSTFFRLRTDTQCAPKRVNFPNSPGDCLGKRGSPAREGFPWHALLIQNRVLEGHSLLQSAPLLQNNPPDCSAIHSPQSALRVSTSEAVKSSPISVSCVNGGLCPLDTHKPFFEGLDPKIYILSVRKALPYSIKYTRFSGSLP